MREKNHSFDHDPGKTPVEEQRKLRKTGNSYGVTLSRKALDAAGLSPDTPVTVRSEKGRVVISAAGGAYDAVMDAYAECRGRYARTLDELSK
ncbi:MAG: hypothetical protein ABL308_03320 [Oceanicaulis sp.]